MPDFDVVVIGGGVIGASIFYHLVRAGYRTGLFEKKKIASGCTQWSAGIIRCFHLDSILTDRALESWKYYNEFQKNTGAHCEIHQSGFIYIPKKSHQQTAMVEIKRLSPQLPIQWLNKSELIHRFGNLFNQLPEGMVYEPEAGYVCAKTVTQAWTDAGCTYGGKIYEYTAADNITQLNDKVINIETTSGKILTKRIVLATGADTPAILNQLSCSHHFYVKNIRMDLRLSSTLSISHPAFIDDQTNLYGRPDLATGAMYISLPTGKLSMSFILDKQHSEVIYQTGSERFSWVKDSKLITSLSHPDAYSADGRGYIMALNANQNIFLASGFSGGGFKQAPWVGQKVTRLIRQGKTRYE